MDEGNQQYKFQWLRNSEPVSGHDWIGSVTRLSKPARMADGSLLWERDEFVPPIVWLEDRLDDREIELGRGEKVCNDCNLAFNLRLTNCPVCQEVNA